MIYYTLVSIIKNFFVGVLKMRFRCILKDRVLKYQPHKAGQIINATCVLHNMCIRGNLPFEEAEIIPPEEVDQQLQNNDLVARDDLRQAQQRREELIHQYFN